VRIGRPVTRLAGRRDDTSLSGPPDGVPHPYHV